MNIAPNGHSAQQEKKVANKLYRDIIIAVIVAAMCLITYGFLNKDIRTRVQKPDDKSAVESPVPNPVPAPNDTNP